MLRPKSLVETRKHSSLPWNHLRGSPTSVQEDKNKNASGQNPSGDDPMEILKTEQEKGNQGSCRRPNVPAAFSTSRLGITSAASSTTTSSNRSPASRCIMHPCQTSRPTSQQTARQYRGMFLDATPVISPPVKWSGRIRPTRTTGCSCEAFCPGRGEGMQGRRSRHQGSGTFNLRNHLDATPMPLTRPF